MLPWACWPVLPLWPLVLLHHRLHMVMLPTCSERSPTSQVRVPSIEDFLRASEPVSPLINRQQLCLLSFLHLSRNSTSSLANSAYSCHSSQLLLLLTLCWCLACSLPLPLPSCSKLMVQFDRQLLVYTGFLPYAGEGFALLLPSKWNPSKEVDFPGVVLRCGLTASLLTNS